LAPRLESSLMTSEPTFPVPPVIRIFMMFLWII
jgi:hypothetical protein